ncbi:MAG: nucleotidyltransferase domain-containing protein [Dictyoglomus sp.]|nr:nucleotidyltransferase domain-containing protein [Dictyoglomus sp.]MCX7941879.1 nucleotidyltransferase domain-containing protein [Dictyoglomaceae bacterium]MDW8188265.1 nucleotidyltransferase domain-containing protein [Dictyoglomus sp.]
MKEKILEKKEEIKKIFEEKGVILAYIFGSFAKGNISNLSDIDVAILFSEDIPKENYFDLKLEISYLLLEILRELKRDVDLVILNDASLILKYQVIKYGEIIYKKDEKTRVDFEEETIKNYLDTKPIRDENFKYLLKRIQDGKVGYVHRFRFDSKKDGNY